MGKRAVVEKRRTEEIPAKLTLSVAEAADLLGFTRKRLEHLIVRKLFPHRRIGARRIVILRTELQQWLACSLPGVTLEETVGRGAR